MAWSIAEQIYEEVVTKKNIHILIMRLNELTPEYHQAIVADFIAEKAKKEQRDDIVEIAKSYAANRVKYQPWRKVQ